MPKSAAYHRMAKNARKRGEECIAKASATYDNIPFGQPIITGRGSRTTADINRRERASRNMHQAFEEMEKARGYERSARRAEAYETRLETAQTIANAEGVNVGDEVIACFTRNYRDYRFRGRIIRRTVNTWKVQPLESPDLLSYPDGYWESIIFTIPVIGYDKRASARNRVYALADAPKE